jgi:hypothetical protein
LELKIDRAIKQINEAPAAPLQIQISIPKPPIACLNLVRQSLSWKEKVELKAKGRIGSKSGLDGRTVHIYKTRTVSSRAGVK